ncbi:hypothetical protein OGAPHI_001157 [Ogataea philodendri]|uniref:Uncharacterized protein n=1 Tax=Ogataea philodendri TaxID=1378263 RepID=A0A9P8PF02_9ASCO|nr:uncharacterized protein OGAPHI_001157 [Ogataea philodendri]KAH3670642.1 hypothetical protein OGAPHI_001157 [Ogataea philodendri]
MLEYHSSLVALPSSGSSTKSARGFSVNTRLNVDTSADQFVTVGTMFKNILNPTFDTTSAMSRNTLVAVQPSDGLVASLGQSLSLGSLNLLFELLLGSSLLQRVSVRLQSVLSSNSLSLLLVLVLELLGLGNHSLDLLLRQSTLVVGDGDLLSLTGTLLKGRNVQDSVSVNVEGDLNLWNTSWSWWNTRKLELTKQVVVLGSGSLSLVNLDQHTRLVVGVCGESLGLLGWDGGVSWDQLGHDTTGSLDTKRQWSNVQKQQVLGLGRSVTRQNGSLDSSTVSNSLIWVDGSVWLLTVEEVRNELLHLWNSGGTTNKNNLVNLRLVKLGVLQNLLDRVQGGSEKILTKLLESGSGDGGVEVNTLVQGVNLQRGLSRGGKSSLGSLTSGSESSQSSLVTGEVLLVLSLEFVDEVVHQSVVEILTTQVSVTGSGLNLEDTVLDGKQRDIKSSSTKIEDQDVLLALALLVQTVGNGSSSRLVDNSHNVQTGNQTSVLGGLSLRVVEVSWNGDNSVVNLGSEESLRGLSHLGQDHRGDLFWGENLGLTLELNLDLWLTALVDNLEWEVLNVTLDLRVVELSTNQSLSVEHSVLWVHSGLVLSSITNQSLGVGEGDERWSGSVTLVVGDNLNSVVGEVRNTRVAVASFTVRYLNDLQVRDMFDGVSFSSQASYFPGYVVLEINELQFFDRDQLILSNAEVVPYLYSNYKYRDRFEAKIYSDSEESDD